jgi:Dolichyl-phosphate-mannose-protein mannosyltransferase
MRSAIVMRRLLYCIAWLAPAWALITIATDGVAWRLGPLRLSSTEPIRPLLVGIVAVVIYLRRSTNDEIVQDGRWLEQWVARVALVATPLIILLGGIVGVVFGSFAAAGSDSYGYVSQASLWLHGDLHIEQPIVRQMSWPTREWTFAPLGYRPISEDGTIVPTYAPGLPMLMAAFLRVFGPNGPFLVVPVLGTLALWFTYLLGREATGSRRVGALAALLLLSSPPFLAQVMLPMTDVPVAAGWALVCLLALKHLRPRPMAAGLVAGATLLVRPNLVPLALAPLAGWLAPCVTREMRPRAIGHAWRFALGLLPGVVAIAVVNWRLYGSPLMSGYGGLGDQYGWQSAPENIRNYTRWLVETQTPLVTLALVALAARHALRSPDQHSSRRACFAAMLALTLLCYIFYNTFAHWSYLRFLLPAYPVLFVLMAAGVRSLCLKLPVVARAPAAVLFCALTVPSTVMFAKNQSVFTSANYERRHIRAAEHVERLTPVNAVIICSQHSGSLRFYANRITLRYDTLSGDGLDAVLRELREKGYRPYIVLDDWEEKEFRNRFAKQSRAGRLDWRPLVRVLTLPEVRIYDPEGRAE